MEKKSNQEEISEKEEQIEQSKSKSLADCPLTDHQDLIQVEDLEWTLMADNKRKNIKRLLMEDITLG